MLLSIFAFIGLFGEKPQQQLMVGSYTKDNPGIEIYDVSNLNDIKKSYSLNVLNASYQTLSDDGKFMYSVTEKGLEQSSVSAFQKNAKGQYVLVNQQSTQAADPCFVLYRKASKTVYTANYSGGSVSVFKTKNGALLPLAQKIQYEGSGTIKGRQESSHAHKVVLSPDQKELLVTDLGCDKIYLHSILPDGTLNPKFKTFEVKPGKGPRHLIFHPNGKIIYVINELNGTVDVFSYSNHQLQEIQSVQADFSNEPVKASADIHLSKDAKWLISSNRITSNSLSVFKVQKDGTIRYEYSMEVGSKPRNFSFDPSGKFVFVASSGENKIQLFSFNNENGQLIDTGKTIAVQSPVCLTFIR